MWQKLLHGYRAANESQPFLTKAFTTGSPRSTTGGREAVGGEESVGEEDAVIESKALRYHQHHHPVRISATTFESDKCAYHKWLMINNELHDYTAETYLNHYQLSEDESKLELKEPGVDPIRMFREGEEGTENETVRKKEMRRNYITLRKFKTLTVPAYPSDGLDASLKTEKALYQIRKKKSGDRIVEKDGERIKGDRVSWYETEDELVWEEENWKYSGGDDETAKDAYVNGLNFDEGGFENVKVEHVEARPILRLITQVVDTETGRRVVRVMPPVLPATYGAGGLTRLLERVVPGTKRKVVEGDRVWIGVLPFKVEQIQIHQNHYWKQRPKLGVSGMGKRAPVQGIADADSIHACNYCLASENTDADPLLHCCGCQTDGEPQYKHVKCIQRFEENRAACDKSFVCQRRKDKGGESYVLQSKCRECKQTYNMAFESVSSKTSLLSRMPWNAGDPVGESHLFDVGRIAPPFAVLKCSFGNEDQMRHQDNLLPLQKYLGTQLVAAYDPNKKGDEKYKVTIGRFPDKDDLPLIDYVQGSTNHAQISFDKDGEEGTFHIQDKNGSKFGVFLEIGPDGIELDSEKPLELRFGGMALKIQY